MNHVLWDSLNSLYSFCQTTHKVLNLGWLRGSGLQSACSTNKRQTLYPASLNMPKSRCQSLVINHKLTSLLSSKSSRGCFAKRWGEQLKGPFPLPSRKEKKLRTEKLARVVYSTTSSDLGFGGRASVGRPVDRSVGCLHLSLWCHSWTGKKQQGCCSCCKGCHGDERAACKQAYLPEVWGVSSVAGSSAGLVELSKCWGMQLHSHLKSKSTSIQDLFTLAFNNKSIRFQVSLTP